MRWPALLVPLAAMPAHAQSVSGSVAGLSDYRFRGLSRSDRDPAAQATLDVSAPGGFYAGAFASTVGGLNGAAAEIDLSAGISRPLGPLTASAGATGYLFPGGRRGNLYELQGTLGYSIATATLTAGLDLAPGQSGIPRADRYAYVSLAYGIPRLPVSLTATVGAERGGEVARATGRAAKLDWRAGAEYRRHHLAFGLHYVATDLPRAVRQGRDGVVGSVTLRF